MLRERQAAMALPHQGSLISWLYLHAVQFEDAEEGLLLDEILLVDIKLAEQLLDFEFQPVTQLHQEHLAFN